MDQDSVETLSFLPQASSSTLRGAEIVDVARELLGMPYLHQGRPEQGVTDCIGPLVYVADRLGLDDAVAADVRDYPLETDGALLIKTLSSVCHRVDAITLGDVLVFRRGRRLWHAGFLSKLFPMSVIHAWVRPTGGLVCEDALDEKWIKALHSAWRYGNLPTA